MLKILLLEDDFKLASEIRLFLESQDYKCDVVYDGMLFLSSCYTFPITFIYLTSTSLP